MNSLLGKTPLSDHVTCVSFAKYADCVLQGRGEGDGFPLRSNTSPAPAAQRNPKRIPEWPAGVGLCEERPELCLFQGHKEGHPYVSPEFIWFEVFHKKAEPTL